MVYPFSRNRLRQVSATSTSYAVPRPRSISATARMRAEAPVWRRSEPLIIKLKLDSIADVELGVETEAGAGIAAFNLGLPRMTVIHVLRSAIGECYKKLT